MSPQGGKGNYNMHLLMHWQVSNMVLVVLGKFQERVVQTPYFPLYIFMHHARGQFIYRSLHWRFKSTSKQDRETRAGNGIEIWDWDSGLRNEVWK